MEGERQHDAANSEEAGRGRQAKISSYTTAFSVDTIDVLGLTLTAPRMFGFIISFNILTIFEKSENQGLEVNSVFQPLVNPGPKEN